MIYLDYNATAPLKPQVKEVMNSLPFLPFNPSSVHRLGREARKRLEEARNTLLQVVKGEGYRLVFTASGTEANNLALKGLKGYTVLASAVEHISVLRSAEQPVLIPVDGDGVVDKAALERLLQEMKGPKLVSVMVAGNETGVLQPIAEIAALAKHYGALVHSDAVQGFGKIPVDMGQLGVDMLSISAHKCGGPHGIGALIMKRNVPLSAIIHGGGQELGFRAGTENLAAAVGFAAAVVGAEEIEEEQQRLLTLQQQLEEALLPEAVILGKNARRLAGTSLIAMPGVSSETQLIHFDLEGIALSSGSACSSGRVTISHVLCAMGVAEELASSVVRVSMGRGTTATEVSRFIAAWKALYTKTT